MSTPVSIPSLPPAPDCSHLLANLSEYSESAVQPEKRLVETPLDNLPDIPIILHVVSEIERNAVLHLMTPLAARNSEEAAIWDVTIASNYTQLRGFVGTYGRYPICLVQSDRESLKMIVTVQAAISAFRPSVIIAVGTQFGRDPISQRPGDVIVSNSIYDCSRRTMTQIDASLLQQFQSITGWAIEHPYHQAKTGPSHEKKWVLSIVAPIISGQELAYGFCAFPTTKAGELEGLVIHDLAVMAGAKFIVVKAISEFAGGNTKDWQPFAAHCAASLVHKVLSNRGFAAALRLDQRPQRVACQACKFCPSSACKFCPNCGSRFA